MQTTIRGIRSARGCTLFLVFFTLLGCHLSDVLKVPTPAGVSSGQQLANQSGAEAVFLGAKDGLFGAVYNSSLIEWTELLTDEFVFSGYQYEAVYANMDARRSVGSGVSGFQEEGDYPWAQVLQARSALLLALPGLQAYEPSSGRPKLGEAYALLGYSELLVAESYCGGTPLSTVLPAGGIQYGVPLTDDSILGVAQAHFDSAVAYAVSNDTTLALASVGLGRVLLDRGQFAAAAAAVQNVPAAFVYNSQLEPNWNGGSSNAPNIYALGVLSAFSANFNVADGKGGNGLNFRSANDPRLTFDTSYLTLDGAYGGAVPATWYLPTRFSTNLSYIPLATGIEAALIQAEAALQGNDATTWLADLNALRNSGCTYGSDTVCAPGTGQVVGQTAGLPPLQDPGTDSGRVSLMFRERAFWLYGTGTRLGDLRRLIRQYGRDQSTVFPTGVYPNGNNPNLPSPISTYGTDVNMTLPTAAAISNGFAESNPNYKGCTTPTTQA